jgi:uncharacterized damage-inducible protein DinB
MERGKGAYMISPDYCVTISRYNAWQNKQMKAALEALSPQALTQERGAFFGSILKTVNHLLWGDQMWMSRFDNGAKPQGGVGESVALTPTLAVWSSDRFRTDGRILRWAEQVRSVDLVGELRWYSGIKQADVTMPMGLCVAHMFNHQTHHRGQVHAMLTAAGGQGWITDLFLMPQDGPWL